MRQASQSGKLLFSNQCIDTCGRATTLRVEANVFENGEKKCCVFKRIRIRVDRALI